MKIIVIGSGFGGLAAANRLVAKGHEVHIYEKRDQAGGRAYQYQINGFKFDGGPTVITAPYIFDEIFEAAGKRRGDYFNLVPLDPFYRIFNHEGEYFNYFHDPHKMLDEVRRWNPDDVSGFERLVEHTRKLFTKLHPYTDQPFLHFAKMAKIIPDVIKLQGYRSTYGLVSRYIKHPFLRRVFSFHPLLVGGNPFDTPALYTLIVQFEKQWGVHYATGGTGAIVDGMVKLFNDLGGKLHLNKEVREITVNGSKVNGVRFADGNEEKADVVISNADAPFTYRFLLPEDKRRHFTNKRIDNGSYSNSLFVIYFGTKKRYLDSALDHHNIIINKRYRSLLRDIFSGKKGIPDDFSLYLHMPTITDPTIAPAGCESFYVLSLVPNLSNGGTDWEHFAPEYKEKVLEYLQNNYLPELKSNIIAEHYIDPIHFQSTLNSYHGAAFSLKPSLMQSAYFRPHNRSEDFKNLYFVGAGTHPGAGVPAVLSSGKIAAELIDPS